VFRRRTPRKPLKQVRELVWPSSGWVRTTRYLAHRLARLPGTPYSIAAGFATGAAISFTPFIGAQLILAAAISWLMRANILASAAGTIVANPWTLPFIWLWIYHFGRAVTGGGDRYNLPDDLTFGYVASHAWDILVPMTAGGLLTAVFVWVVAYFPAQAAVAGYQRRRRSRRAADSRSS
jgi:hypothetical protein